MTLPVCLWEVQWIVAGTLLLALFAATISVKIKPLKYIYMDSHIHVLDEQLISDTLIQAQHCLTDL